MAFDLASVLKNDVPNPGTGREQIEYIPLELIDPDPNNFYNLSGLDDLAASIETVGLQQPIRVRTGENGHVTVVSGHRRRAACMMIVDGGNDLFKDGVPCIREADAGSPALQELRLIFANSSTREMTAAEKSKQAERVEELLYRLKEEGYSFPGRMRDHVATACNMSKTKLSRLHAIRANLIPAFLRQFDEGKLTEAAAYELQQFPADIQRELADEKLIAKGKVINGECAANGRKMMNNYGAGKKRCPDGQPCDLLPIERLKKTVWAPYSWKKCEGGCCLSCYEASSCSFRCTKCREKEKSDKAAAAAEKSSRKEKEAKEQERRRSSIQAEAQRFLPVIEAAGLTDDDKICRNVTWDFKTVKAIREFASGEFGNGYFYSNRMIVPDGAGDIVRLAKQLHCSADFICGLTDDPVPVPDPGTTPEWRTGLPTESGRYLFKTEFFTDIMNFNAEDGTLRFLFEEEPEQIGVLAWYPIPQK